MQTFSLHCNISRSLVLDFKGIFLSIAGDFCREQRGNMVKSGSHRKNFWTGRTDQKSPAGNRLSGKGRALEGMGKNDRCLASPWLPPDRPELEPPDLLFFMERVKKEEGLGHRPKSMRVITRQQRIGQTLMLAGIIPASINDDRCLASPWLPPNRPEAEASGPPLSLWSKPKEKRIWDIVPNGVSDSPQTADRSE